MVVGVANGFAETGSYEGFCAMGGEMIATGDYFVEIGGGFIDQGVDFYFAAVWVCLEVSVIL